MTLLLGRHYEFPQCGIIKEKLLLAKTGGRKIFLNDLAERVYIPDKTSENKWSRRSTRAAVRVVSTYPHVPKYAHSLYVLTHTELY
jgi:hypothetical protein